MYQEKIKEAEGSMNEVLDFLKKELSKIRTGRANIELVSDILVDYYGTKTLLKQLATIAIPELQMITIQPYDKNSIKEIEKAMQTSNLGLVPNNEGNIIRIKIPPLTEERRKEIVNIMSQKLEETKMSLRSVREKAWKEIRDFESRSLISEDDKYKAQEELNKLISEYNERAGKLGEIKEKEIMSL